MTQKDNILQELSELKSTLATITPQNIYTVPAGYFDGLAAQVLNRIKAIEAANAAEELGYLSPVLSGISKQMPYSIPSGYFEGLAERAIQSVRESSDYQTAKEELETISPLLSGLKKQIPYSVPQGYFENLTEKIVAEEKKPVVKIISITSRKWFRYAAAAMITGVIVMAGFLYFNDTKEPGGKALAKFTRDVKKLDETQKENMIEFIDGGLNSKQDLVAVNTGKVNIEKQNEIKELLQGVSDEELKNFQEQTEDIEDVLMTN
jgi:hypothetical protein